MPAIMPRVGPDIGPILRLVRKTRLLLRGSWGAVGVGQTLGLAFAALALVTAADMLAPLVAPWVRLAGLGLFVVPTLAIFVWKGVIPLSRRLRNVEVARRIESRIPGMHSRLVSCMDLAGREGEVSPAFYRKLVDESLDRIGKYRSTSVVDFRAIRKSLRFALIGIALFALLWLGFGSRLTTALARVFNPFADIPPASDVAFTVEPGTTKVLVGEDVNFAATVTKGEPEALVAELVGAGSTVRHPLKKDTDGVWRLTLRGLSAEKGFENGFTFRIFGGRTWTQQNRIDWAERPVILDTQVRLYFPDYMAIPEPRPNPPKERDVFGPVGSRVEVAVEVEGDVASGDIQLLEARVKRTPNRDRRERIWFDLAIPTGALPTGDWRWESSSAVRAKAHYTPATAGATTAHGFNSAGTPFVVNSGEVFFTHLYLDPANPPETVMLQWIAEGNDGEHRAYWGVNRIEQGNNGTASRHYLGPIPKDWIGQWKHVEVPAAAVGLEGKKLIGMAFLQFAGQAKWAAGGASQPAVLEEREYVVSGRYSLQLAGERLWVGSFPLAGAGQYRIELRNQIGHANKPASEHPKYEAVPDQPPFVTVERPGTDLVLSKPDKLPITIVARDDYGLLDLWIATQREGELKFTRSAKVKEYAAPNPLRADAVVASLDLTASGFDLNAGDTLRYRAEIRDRRPNSEPSFSKDFTVRISEDPNAADKLLDAFEKGQDTFRDKLVNLIAEQKKVKEKIDQAEAKHDALNTKVQAAIEEAKAKAKPKDGQPPKDVNPPVDPKEAAEMAELRKELTDLFGQEQKNVAAAAVLEQELKNLAAQAQKNSLLNGAINKEMQDLANQFKNAALDPLQELASKLQQGVNPAQATPDLKGVKGQSDRVQKNLESMKSRMDALANAEKGLKSDAEKALAKLKEDLVKEQGKMTAQDLAELKDFLKNLREELAKMQGKQEDLADKTDKAPDKELPDVEQKQLTLDELLKKDLDLAKKILDREKARRMRKPEFPDEPFAGDPKERKTAPKEEDTTETDPKKANRADPTSKLPPKKKDGIEDDEDLFKPALKGEREKLDPRFDKKIRPTPKKDGKNDPSDRRDNLREHQQDNLRDLDAAQKGLKSDEQTLEEMIQSLLNASQKGNPDQPNDPSGKGQMDQLMQMLRSEAMKTAMQMAQRARQSGKGQPPPGTPQSPPTGSAADSVTGNSVGGAGVLDELDARTRATILQLPARVREELLQGMKAQGPEGYQKFIQDYFRRLAEAQK
jgi:hypothetical protein